MLYIIAGLIIGGIAGFKLNIGYNPEFGIYISLIILAIINGIFNLLYDNFSKEINIPKSGVLLIADLVFAMMLGYIGEQLGLPIYLAAVFAFGNNIYSNIKNLVNLAINKYNEEK